MMKSIEIQLLKYMASTHIKSKRGTQHYYWQPPVTLLRVYILINTVLKARYKRTWMQAYSSVSKKHQGPCCNKEIITCKWNCGCAEKGERVWVGKLQWYSWQSSLCLPPINKHMTMSLPEILKLAALSVSALVSLRLSVTLNKEILFRACTSLQIYRIVGRLLVTVTPSSSLIFWHGDT